MTYTFHAYRNGEIDPCFTTDFVNEVQALAAVLDYSERGFQVVLRPVAVACDPDGYRGWPGDGSGEDDLADFNANEVSDYQNE